MDKILFAMVCVLLVSVAIAFEPTTSTKTVAEPPRVIYVPIYLPADQLPDLAPNVPEPRTNPELPYYQSPLPSPYGCPGCQSYRSAYVFPVLGAPFRWIARGFLRARYRILYHY